MTAPRGPLGQVPYPGLLDPERLSGLGTPLPAVPREVLELGPAVVGATGGSGTRVVATILRRAGLYIGNDLNESDDALRFGDYSSRWIDTYLALGRAVSASVKQAMVEDLNHVLGAHCAPLESSPGRWGWKEPRSIYLLPIYVEHLPSLRFVHIVRDGRDMALSTNQNQLQMHADAAGIDPDLADPVRSIALWSWINLETAEYGARELGDRYMRIRFEDLCSDPVGVTRSLYAFLQLDAFPAPAVDIVASPETIGRWRTAEPELRAQLEDVGGEALRTFAYPL